MLIGAISVLWVALGAFAKIIYNLQDKRITALEAENATLRTEARAAVLAKDEEIRTLRDIAARLAEERAKETAWRREQPA